jgi:EAL and modified HD-GYP domain-containing signal transduction protein
MYSLVDTAVVDRGRTDADAQLRVQVARQGIYDRDGAVVGYELLFRADADASAAARRDAFATAQVMVAAFTEFGLHQLTGGQVCFVNVTEDFLVGTLPLPFGYGDAVLEVLETVDVDDAVVAGVRGLVEQGYTVALDDFVFGASHEPLLDLATYVKIDLLHADPAEVRATAAACRRHPHLQLIAERLETPEALQLAMELGFDLFQGHILGRPHVEASTALAPAQLTRLQILADLTAPDADLDSVTAIVVRDPALSVRLLRATNSAAAGLSRTVASIGEAVVLLGLQRLRDWTTLMLLTDLTEAGPDQLSTLLTRARLCQTLARRTTIPPDAAYLGGLLAAVADRYRQNRATISDSLPLHPMVSEALAAGTGPLGELLAKVDAYCRGVAGPAEVAAMPPDVGPLTYAYFEALRWSTQLVGALPPDTGR